MVDIKVNMQVGHPGGLRGDHLVDNEPDELQDSQRFLQTKIELGPLSPKALGEIALQICLTCQGHPRYGDEKVKRGLHCGHTFCTDCVENALINAHKQQKADLRKKKKEKPKFQLNKSIDSEADMEVSYVEISCPICQEAHQFKLKFPESP